MKDIVWQFVRNNDYEFKVLLDRDFAKIMVTAEISPDYQKRLNELATEELKRLGINWISPYTFHANSGFISQIYLGQNGVWLSANHQNIESILKNEKTSEPIEYYSHNVDTSKQAFGLMAMMALWVHYSDVIIKK